MASAKNFLTDEEKDKVVAAIRQAEMHTSGEIRIRIDDRCDGEVYDHAVKIFHILKMEKTSFRNAVLLYIAVKDRKFSVVGDEALHHKVKDDFWNSVTGQLQQDFKNEDYCGGIIKSIHTIGVVLEKHFPDIDQPNRNVLSDDISFE